MIKSFNKLETYSMDKQMERLLLFSLVIQSVAGSCNFPSDWTGSWLHSLHGTVTLTTSTMQLSEYPDGSVTLNCDTLVSSRYLVLSDQFTEADGGNPVYLLACLEITQLKTNLYKIIHRTPKNSKANFYRYVETASNAVSEGTLCSDTTADPDVEYYLMMKSGEINNVKIDAPTPFLGTLAYTFDGNKCSGNTGSASACTDNTLIDIDYTRCSDVVGYSTSGHLNVIHFNNSNDVYQIWTFNQDSSVDNNATYKFACFIASYSGNAVEATQNPQFCDATQTSTTAASNGKTIVGTLTVLFGHVLMVRSASDMDRYLCDDWSATCFGHGPPAVNLQAAVLATTLEEDCTM